MINPQQWSQLPLFLHTLEEKGFVLLAERYDLVLQIAQRSPDLGGFKLRLGALLSSSAQQQQEFAAWFEQFFYPNERPEARTEVEKERRPDLQRIQETLDRQLETMAQPLPDASSKPFPARLRYAIILSILALIWIVWQNHLGNGIRAYLIIWGLLLFYLVFLFIAYFFKKKKRPFTLKREQLNAPDTFFDIHIPPHSEVRFSRSFQGIARRLRQRLPSDQPVLNVSATIRKSILQGGFFTPQYQYRSKSPAYLLLIDQSSKANHRFQLAELLYHWLHKQEIEVERFWYRSDPRSCWNEALHGGISLEQLAQRYPESRLLLFGDAWLLLNPLTQKLAAWAQTFAQWDTRNLITPIVPQAWTRKEEQLGKLFILAPASVEGLRYWSEAYSSGAEQNQPKVPHWQENVVFITEQNFQRALPRHFPDQPLREWLCALACFPKLNWELTLRIGTVLSAKRGTYLLDYNNLRRLTRLSWFHNGFIPEELRKLLYSQLDKELAKEVHQCIIQVLAEQLQDGKSHFTLTRREMELQIVVQQVAAGMAKAVELKRYWESSTDQDQVADFLVLHYLEQAHDTPLPEKLAALLKAGRQQLQELLRKPKSFPTDDEEVPKPAKDEEKNQEKSRPLEVPFEFDPADLEREVIRAPQMIQVAGGSFTLGGKHTASLDDFEISQTAITFDMYDAFCRATGRDLPTAERWGRDNRPVIYVDWYDTLEYCNWLSTATGLEPVYTIDKATKDPHNTHEKDEKKWTIIPNWNANGYRLPTEAEWEYAARGGQQSKGYTYAGSNKLDEVGWYWENSGDKKLTGDRKYEHLEKNNCRTHPVAEKKPNELDLYDLSGNVWEWCWDWYQEYDKFLPRHNPLGFSTGNSRMVRGGSWYNNDFDCQVFFRVRFVPDFRGSRVGFRVVCRRLTL